MTTSPYPLARRTPTGLLRFLGQAIRGLTAAVVLLTLIAALPWALGHYVGWPLPDHIPAAVDVQGLLLGPMSTSFLVNVLACSTWWVWAVFIVDLARCAAEIARGTGMPDLSAAGPVQRVAAALIGSVLIWILNQRGAQAPLNSLSTGHSLGSDVMMTTSAWSYSFSPDVERTAPEKSAVVMPPDPVTGVHDCLWRIAERTLGDGHRWPDIFELNKGKPQPDGGTFTRPDMIFPGERFVLPTDAATPMTPPTPTATPHTPTPPTGKAPSTTTQPPPPIMRTPAGTDASSTGEQVASRSEELLVALGLAAAISATSMLARRRYRGGYRPGSHRTDLPGTPVVYPLRPAQPRPRRETDTDEPGEWPQRPSGSSPSPERTDTQFGSPTTSPSVNVREGQRIALDLAATHGLGLIGPGASGAIRALLLTSLAPTGHVRPGRADVLVPDEDFTILLGHQTAHTPLPTALRVLPGRSAVLDALEAETLVRANQSRPEAGWPPLILVTCVPERQRQRLQAILENGSGIGVTGLLLGQWASGATAYVRDDGTVSTTSPGVGEPLRGARVFRSGGSDTPDLLALLHRVDRDDSTPDNAREPVEKSERVVTDGPADTDLEILGSAPASAHTMPARAAAGGAENTAGRRQHERLAVAVRVPLRISVLGPPRVWWRPQPPAPNEEHNEREITSAFQPRVRELLIFLALHPAGASREALVAALWASSPPEKTTNAMNTSLSRLRRSLAAATGGAVSDVVLVGESRYRLDPAVVEVDYHRFAAAVAARRTAATEQGRVEAYRRIVDSYTGSLADGLSTEWIETAREAIRRDAIDAVAALARALVDHDPQQTLDLLEVARTFDPHNELIYRDIMRLQERLGQLNAIPRTLSLLNIRLSEIEDRPTSQTVELAERLRRRHDTAPDRHRVT